MSPSPAPLLSGTPDNRPPPPPPPHSFARITTTTDDDDGDDDGSDAVHDWERVDNPWCLSRALRADLRRRAYALETPHAQAALRTLRVYDTHMWHFVLWARQFAAAGAPPGSSPPPPPPPLPSTELSRQWRELAAEERQQQQRQQQNKDVDAHVGGKVLPPAVIHVGLTRFYCSLLPYWFPAPSTSSRAKFGFHAMRNVLLHHLQRAYDEWQHVALTADAMQHLVNSLYPDVQHALAQWKHAVEQKPLSSSASSSVTTIPPQQQSGPQLLPRSRPRPRSRSRNRDRRVTFEDDGGDAHRPATTTTPGAPTTDDDDWWMIIANLLVLPRGICGERGHGRSGSRGKEKR